MKRLAAFAALAAVACEPGAAAPVSLPPLAAAGPSQEAADAAVRPAAAPGRCPEDAPWNGRICVGMAYVACPGERRIDDAGVCVGAAAALDAGRDSAR